MRRSPVIVLLVAIATLALPAVSLAQSAGDDQYTDPLAGHHGSGHTGGGGGTKGSAGSTGTGTSQPATQTPAAASTPSSSTSSTPTATAAAAPRGQLPRTGFDVIVTIELGMALLLTGLVAQRVLVLRDRR